jgi:hypothetical protein
MIYSPSLTYEDSIFLLGLLGACKKQSWRAAALHLTARISEFPKPSISWVPIELFPTILGVSNVLEFRFDEGTYQMACLVLDHSAVDDDPRPNDFNFIWTDPHLILHWLS